MLQRRQGYREVLRHFIRLRMTTRIPFDEGERDLLEVKDIASPASIEVKRTRTSPLVVLATTPKMLQPQPPRRVTRQKGV